MCKRVFIFWECSFCCILEKGRNHYFSIVASKVIAMACLCTRKFFLDYIILHLFCFNFGSVKASPGNLQQFDEILFTNNDMSESAIVMSLKIASDGSGQRVCFKRYYFLMFCYFFLYWSVYLDWFVKLILVPCDWVIRNVLIVSVQCDLLRPSLPYFGTNFKHF